MDEEQEERGFTVSDRRFSSRSESDAPRPREPSPPHSGIVGEQARAPGQADPHAAEPPDEINFASFVISLGTQAFMHLGDIPNPMTQQREKDLGAVKQMIDLLSMLQHKTRGNLTADEERLLQQLLFDLRMRYVREAGR